MSGDRAVPGDSLAIGDGDQRSRMVVLDNPELAHREHVGLALDLALDKRNRSARRIRQLLRRRRHVVGGKHRRNASRCARARDHSEAHGLRKGEQSIETGSFQGPRRGKRSAIERRRGGVEQDELAAGLEVGEVDKQIGPLG